MLKRKLPSEVDTQKKAAVDAAPIFEPTPGKFGQDGGVNKVKEFIDACADDGTSISQPLSIEIRDEGSLQRQTPKHRPKLKTASVRRRPARNEEVVSEMKTYHVSLIS